MGVHMFFLAFTLLWQLSSGMQCYKCDPERMYDIATPALCEDFDGSARYVANCEHSTMCYKRTTSLVLGNGLTTTTTERGCASQTMSGEQAVINGKWTPVSNIYEMYEEGCAKDPSDIERATTTVYCYCRGDQCNHALKYSGNVFVLLIIIIGLVIS